MFRVGGDGSQGHGPLGDGRTLAHWWSTAPAARPSEAPAPPAKASASDPEYMSIKALASYSGISARTLRTLLKDPVNPIPCRRIGGKILVRRGEYDGWADQFRGAGADDETSRAVDEMLRGLTRSARLADTRAHITERG